MHFARESSQANVIRAVEGRRVRVGEQWYGDPLIVAADSLVENWHAPELEALTLASLDPVLALEPEIVLIGTGNEAVLPDVELIAALAERGVGLEIMTTPAACRTFNVLVNELRRVVMALLRQP